MYHLAEIELPFLLAQFFQTRSPQSPLLLSLLLILPMTTDQDVLTKE